MSEIARSRKPKANDCLELSGARVLVTGGTTGIGRATARMLAAHGARVLIFGRDAEDLDDALGELRSAGGDAHGLVADVSRPEEVRRIFRAADQEIGPLDILVNNAAIAPGPLEQTDGYERRHVVSTNVFGYIACAQEAVSRMKRRGVGHIVNIGSMSADLREEANNAYVATKAAIQAFSESLRKTVNADGIKVTLVEPGRVATDMVSLSAEEIREMAESLEILQPEDVARSVLFCLTQPRRCDVVGVQLRPHLHII